MDNFNERLTEIRQSSEKTQKEIARLLGVAVSTYANWEQGRREPDIKNFLYLCAIFETDPNEFFNWDDNTAKELYGELIKNWNENSNESYFADIEKERNRQAEELKNKK